jgi:hypothetical protein
MEPLRRSNTQYTNTSRQQGEAIIARRTESIDASSITKLSQPSSEALFGRVNVVSLMLVCNTISLIFAVINFSICILCSQPCTTLQRSFIVAFLRMTQISLTATVMQYNDK